jgi:dTDP-4-amino-4,6-dideoxygalactose transaminase
MSPAPDASTIPLFDLACQHRPLREELLAAVAQVAKHERYINGPAVERFETRMAKKHGTGHAIGMSSGTDALLAALMALGIGPGDEVITTPFTFVATAEVIARIGARPVFADLDQDSLLLDPERVQRKIGSRTRAILPVHLFGRACDMHALAKVAASDKLPLIEDCAQAMGAHWAQRPVGSFGRVGALSFFPTKNLGGWGDGGMLLTDDTELAGAARAIRDHGAFRAGSYERLGGNFRLDTLQAAVLDLKLDHFDAWLRQRQAAAQQYETLFIDRQLAGTSNPKLILPNVQDPDEHSFGLYVVRTPERDRLRAHLAELGIATGVYYDRPLHLQACFSELGHRAGDFPVAERAADEVLALPCFAGIETSQQTRIADAIHSFFHPHPMT